ncbi:MAG: hypothetical protein JWO98_1315 [Frankiales bacterium]|nr:hypothetical protein [Frankiales bacterium]
MADDSAGATSGQAGLAAENAALQQVLAAEHVAVWGYGVVGAALSAAGDRAAVAAEAAHRDLRDRLAELLDSRTLDPVPAKAGYALPFPVLSARDAAALAVRLEDGVAEAWVRLLDQAAGKTTRTLAVGALGAGESRAVAWRAAAGQTPVTSAFPGLPKA